ncbi:MAG: CRTAC1 family protein [Okeania sp. SIO2G4]|uniref:CRTAC1 family protein n=1 Tax=unclassified Okeania TaxID=2634635 RepID=UPI0013B93576|nr:MULTISPECIES: CRTAC1 family protein [unclassified Okeania]NEP05341.1 CRTAC1 family protein [Okeania sp. SIO4D6]NEP70695.1 CRTAC1 family protein [Okeania sp. SIO2G5]NEP91939.1 CRTAC1 family protein [Okeania sp. SIO2F5]NEQ89362.1 CRTAC1 family protein [Okeania sp. SIO2G4]
MKMKRNIFIFVGIILISLLVVLLRPQDKDKYPLNANSGFIQEEISPAYSLFDLGVADFNQDTFLDIFSTNHNGPQIFLINQQGEDFKDGLSELGLPQNYEATDTPVPDPLANKTEPGLYIYWHNYELIIAAQGLTNPENLEGLVIVPLLATSTESDQISTNIRKTNALSAGIDKVQVVRFNVKGNGRLSIKFPAFYPFFPPLFRLNPRADIKNIYLGSRFQPATSIDFALPPINALPHMDRHGMAWNDYNNDGNIDIAIVRGGMQGKMSELSPNAKDELMLQQSSGFEDIGEKVGLAKAGCAARQVAWVDFDRDNLLDLYTMCGRKLPPNSRYPNQLYRQTPEGRFINVADEKNLGFKDMGWFTWLDIDNDLDMDLFWADETTFWLYRNESGNFVAENLGEQKGVVNQLAIADYDGDGDLDLFSASRRESILFTNVDGKYQATDPESVGLPKKAFAANWVDYDNDGLIDLHTLRYGIYRQQPDRTFKKINLLEVSSPKTFGGYAYCTWFDVDNDGDRDLLMGKSTKMPDWEKRQRKDKDITELAKYSKSRVLLYRNPGNDNHWLEIELKGAPGNSVAIGAKVKVITANGTQFQEVGQSEGSWRSQGHYRLYFGLGKQDKINSIQVIWPDGQNQEILNPDPDRLLVIEKA